MRFISLLFVLLAGTWGTTFSQYSETIVSDRPGQANTPYTTGAGVLQFQAGLSFGKLRRVEPLLKTWNVENVLRYGLLERFEISVLNGYASWNTFPSNERSTGVNAFQVGGRYNIYKGEGIVPSVGFQAQLKLRAVHEQFRPPNLGSQSLVMIQQTLGKKLLLTTNIGVDWDGWSPRGGVLYVINMGLPIGDRWGVFLENYGNLFYGSIATYLDGGLSFLPGKNIQLDLFAGAGKNGGLEEYFASIGISWRIRHRPLFD